ncbi:MAG: xanthine dehydrogenase small subunit [Planctomycetota bacterium]|jgi:xanthine dehydrogenase small subunit
MSHISFYLDNDLVELDQVDPERTLLQYLREDLRRVGSKEGCAEGDCGACTVVLGELDGGRIRYLAVNACIQFLPTIDGKALFTVESLKSKSGKLHPVQQSLVDHHASQCGFCTPGFVMSMFALYKNESNPERAQIDDALSGNLCRCTGYRPIIDACHHMYDYPVGDDHGSLILQASSRSSTAPSAAEQELIERLQALRRSRAVSIERDSKHFLAPLTLEALAAAYLKHPDSVILAGGTDVGLWVTKQLRELNRVIYLGQVAELQQIVRDEQGLEIPAAVSLTEAVKEICKDYPELGEMFRRFASLPVRNAATLVGNVANGSPIGDSMPALIAIGTRVKLRQGERVREIVLEDLYLDYMKNAMEVGEFIQSIVIPPKNQPATIRCYKLSKRYDQDISAVCSAFSLSLNDGRVEDIVLAWGGMAAIPKRARQTEQFLVGKQWDETNVQVAMKQLTDELSPLSDMRASAAYRSRASANLLYRFYLETGPQQLANEAVNVFAVSG